MSRKDAECSELTKVETQLMASHKLTTSQDSIEDPSKNNDVDAVKVDGEVEGPESAVFRNHVLLKLIGENMDLATLKTVRSLNSFCEEILTPQLLKNSRIVLEAATKSQEQLEVIKDLKGVSELQIIVKLLDESEFGYEKEGEMFTEILEKFAPSLKALKLDFWKIDGLPLPSSSIQFTALTTLVIGDFFEEDDLFIKLVYANAPNLTALVVESYHPDILSPLQADDGSRNWSLAPRLKRLTLKDVDSAEYITSLVNFPQTWESLHITFYSHLEGQDDYDNISLLLANNKDTLVTFSLQQLEQDTPIPVPPGRKTLRLANNFPKLRELTLEVYDPECEILCLGSAIKYAQTFPGLTSLSIGIEMDCDRTSPLWSSLFSPQVFQGLKHFKFAYKHKGIGVTGRITSDWARKIFPKTRKVTISETAIHTYSY